MLAAGFNAAAQNNGVPGPADYPSFSHFITDRNIFDPNRVPHSPSEPRSFRVQRSAPMFSLVGIMSYRKGVFAFFDGNDPDLKKVLEPSGNIAGYTVKDITDDGVTLETADKSRALKLKIGDMMRQESAGNWQMAGRGELAANDNAPTTASDSSSAASSSSSAPPSGAMSDVLKKLMEQRAQELK